ncbi:MAG: deoxyribose-phosphate aldolase [Actinobacteria bacterium]|nr:deoxyribose-phosphate aldolase [Actinomycetota bacterium]
MNPADLAAKIDSTLLRPEATANQIDGLCDEAVQFGFWGVCVSLFWLGRAAKRLDDIGSKVKTITVVAFPSGAIPTAMKVYQTRWALDQGADEIDMVANIGALRGGENSLVQDDIAAVAEVVHQSSSKKILKVILETAVLSKEEKILACRLAAKAGADFVKTSTGTHPSGGATLEDVTLLAKHAAGMKVKAAGGIKDKTTALVMIDAGADRLGTSSGRAIIEELGM